MLRIRDEQMRAFERAAEGAFLNRLVEHLRKHHSSAIVRLPAEVKQLRNLPDSVLRDLAWRGVGRARAFGLTLETTITGFVAIMFEVAPNFDRMPVAQAVLKTNRDAPETRLDVLLAVASGDDWENAVLGYDPASWV